jgi:HKD family nuclease
MGTAPKVPALLLENGDVDHTHEINRLLATATHFICVVAFAKFSGWALIKKVLEKRAAKGLKATFVIGLNFYHSDPKVLRGIRRLQSKATAAGGEINLYIGDSQSRETLHPKAYWFKGSGGEALIVGSANMTWGGLAGNHELSALLVGPAAKQKAWLHDWIGSRIENEEIVEATPDRIKAYEKRRNIYQATMKTAEQRASRAMETDAGDTLTLGDLLVEMRADHSSEGFEQSVARRRANLPGARAQLAVLARQPDVASPAFLQTYEDLIRHWHSSGIERGKTTVAKKPALFQAALRALAAEQSNDPAILFDLLKSYFDAIPRAGTNVLTEILHARDPARFPVMNQNSVAGMGLANITKYPRAPNKTTIDGARYAGFTADAESLRQRLGLGDLSELDALFNYAYHRREEAGEDDEDE